MTLLPVTRSLLQQYRRNVFLLFLLVTVPFIFITLSYYSTVDEPLSFFVTDSGQRVQRVESMAEVHAAIMVPITVAFLAGILGLFVMVEASRSDSRLTVAGLERGLVAAARLVIVLILTAVITIVSIAVTLVNFEPGDRVGFVACNFLIGASYAFLGAIAALVVGRLGGAYLMFFLPMIDAGIFQDPMFISGDQALWMKVLPGFGGTRMVLDAGFTGAMDDWTALAAAIAWAIVLGAAVITLFMTRRETAAN
jgi:hypothetical protein